MYLEDTPIKKQEEDLLHRKNFAKRLGKSLIDTQTKEGYCIGLYGPWGSGKSSVVNMILEEINSITKKSNDKPIVMYFNPWNFSSSEQLLHHEEGVDLLPANIELSAIEVAMTLIMSCEVMMREYLERVREKYGYILIDCMPSLGMMTVNALVAADSVLILVQAAYLPIKGLQQLIKTIAMVSV